MRRQFVNPQADVSATDIARRLAGIQAQVASAAELAVVLRQTRPDREHVAESLWQQQTLVKTWAMRGTLHLLPADEVGAYLALCATVRNWEKPSWQKASGVMPDDLSAIAEAAGAALAGGAALTREELTAAIVDETGSHHLTELLGSGWGPLLKPLAWWGVLCYGPSNGNRVTFVSPAHQIAGWRGLPTVEDAARTVIRAYLGAHGPATAEMFDNWLTRNSSRKKDVRQWFATVADELSTVYIDGVEMYARTDLLDELLATAPTDSVRLLGGFDQYVLGAGTGAAYLIPPEHRSKVSRTAGWISPVVLHEGRVVGVWDVAGGEIAVAPFDDAIPAAPLAAEIARVQAVL